MNTHSARKHRWLLIAAAAAAVALVGCGSVTDTPASSRNTTPAQTSEPTAGRPPQQSPAPTREPDSAQPPRNSQTAGGTISEPGLSRCHTSQLAGGFSDKHSFVSHMHETLTLTNTSATACTMFGFPGIAPARQSGELITTLQFARPPAGRGPEGPLTPQVVVVQPGSSAFFNVDYSVAGMDRPDCASWDLWAVTPPDETDHLYIKDPESGCGPAFVEPVRPTPP